MTAKSYAKVNATLKITEKRGMYHEIYSRFVVVQNLYDTMSFVKNDTKSFNIIGKFDCALEQNTIYKAYMELKKVVDNKKLDNFFQEYALHVDKQIPAYAGLGGGSSNAATFLHMIINVLELDISEEIEMQMASNIGADVAFFMTGLDSANVSGIGEIIEPFEEDLFTVATFTPDIKISTPSVYQEYRKNFYNPIGESEVKRLKAMSTKEMLETYSLEEANDLYLPALNLHPELASHVKKNYFFSGSGSTFFRGEF